MLDAPLQLLIAVVAAVVFRRRGDRLWVAALKGVLASLAATTVLLLVLWVVS